ncbi:hypothetical protein [Wolbachia endosymbiont of Bemisia tabaci]|uniref:hypothetical protein n=1 Tax=Wolbachia endosymbiont of Bemisia tabaci TaxID=215173 RepID=UPI000D55D0D8|nr:hypothetical protein [Wolbachia endosymbiont of Bemisia tabaci]
MIEPVRNYVKEEEIKKDIEEKERANGKDLLKETFQQKLSGEAQQKKRAVNTCLSETTGLLNKLCQTTF